MKIVDRKTFLAMPAGTVFSKYQPCAFGELQIKGDTVADVDFYTQDLVGAIEHNSSDDFADTLLAAQRDATSVRMDFEFQGRDGMFDKEQLFAVWERVDVEELLARLRMTLRPPISATEPCCDRLANEVDEGNFERLSNGNWIITGCDVGNPMRFCPFCGESIGERRPRLSPR